MNYLRISILLFAILFAINTVAQETILKDETTNYKNTKSFGKNRKYYTHFYIGFGFAAPISKEVTNTQIYGKSYNDEFGLRIKYRLSNWLAIGGNISYDLIKYRIKQLGSKTFPDNVSYEKQTIEIQNFSLQPYLRLNFGKRGNKIGKYLDLGYYYNWSLIKQIEEGNIGGYNEVMTKNPGYLNRNNYGILVAFGINRLSIYGKYRISKLITDSKYNYELSPLIIGLQIGIF
jgi:hypothetical protein